MNEPDADPVDPWLFTCIGVRDDLALLPHWLDHYAALGVRPARTVCLLNAASSDERNLARAEAVIAARGAASRRWIAPYTSETMWRARRALQAELAGQGDWVLSADVDEFHEYPAPLDAFLRRCAAMGVTCVQGPFIDRVGPGGRLAPVRTAPALAAQFPVQAEVSLSLFGEGRSHNRYGTVKVMALRGQFRLDRGGHHPREALGRAFLYGAPLAAFGDIMDPRLRFALPTRVHHYHWTEALLDRLERRLGTKGVSEAGAEYGARQLDLLRREGGVPLADVPQRQEASGEDWQAVLRSVRRRAVLVRARRRLAEAKDKVAARSR